MDAFRSKVDDVASACFMHRNDVVVLPLWHTGKYNVYCISPDDVLNNLVSRSQTLTGRVRVWSTAHIRSVLTPTAVGVGDKWVATTTFTLRH